MILRRADKHFDEIIVQAIVKLVLQMPRELGMIEVARMNRQNVGMDWHGQVLEIDQNFDNAVVFTSREGEQRMLVETQMLENPLKGVGSGHAFIVLRRSTGAKTKRGRPLNLVLSSLIQFLGGREGTETKN